MSPPPPPPPATTHTPKKENQDKTKQRNKSYDFTAFFATKRRLRNEYRNSILMTCHHPDPGRGHDWLKQIFIVARPIRSTTQISVVRRYQYRISALVLQTSFPRETSGGVAKCRLFSQANTFSERLGAQPGTVPP